MRPGELLDRALVVLACVLAVCFLAMGSGCEFAYPENQCARSCGARGYTYDNGTGFNSRPARCVCGGATDGSVR